MITAFIVSGELIDHQTIKLIEPVPLENGLIKVVIEQEPSKKISKKELAGMFKGQIHMSEDFSEPIDCMKEYME